MTDWTMGPFIVLVYDRSGWIAMFVGPFEDHDDAITWVRENPEEVCEIKALTPPHD